MCRALRFSLIVLTFAFLSPGAVSAQNQPPPKIAHTPTPPPPWPDASDKLLPMKDPASVDQIREYLRLSGELDSFRVSWLAALDKNRSRGEPYWPEAFWNDVRTEMQTTDLMPMFVTLFQHGISRDLMKDVLDTYRTLGAEHFKGSPACFKLGDAELALSADMDKLKLTKTMEVIEKVYEIYKPQIKAARARYLAEHPNWNDKISPN
jgi:hypothetical protein